MADLEELKSINTILQDKLTLLERKYKTNVKKLDEYERSSFVISEVDAVLNNYFLVSGLKEKNLIKTKGVQGFSEFLWHNFGSKEESDCLAE